MVANPFTKATKKQAKVKMAISGPSGSGKTWTSLEIASVIAKQEGGRVAFLDTEGGSASKYADHFDFDVLELHGDYNPELYVKAIQSAVDHGYSVLVVDSFSHAWNGQGGVLEIVDQTAKKMKDNSWGAWAEGRPAQNRMVSALINARIHIIGTMRSKVDWVLEIGANGKTKPVKHGLASVQDSSFEYEFDITAQMDMTHAMKIDKTRCADLDSRTFEPGEYAHVGETIHSWVTGGEPPQAKRITDYFVTTKDYQGWLTGVLTRLGLRNGKVAQATAALELESFGDYVGTKADLERDLTRIAGELNSSESKPEAKPKTALGKAQQKAQSQAQAQPEPEESLDPDTADVIVEQVCTTLFMTRDEFPIWFPTPTSKFTSPEALRKALYDTLKNSPRPLIASMIQFTKTGDLEFGHFLTDMGVKVRVVSPRGVLAAAGIPDEGKWVLENGVYQIPPVKIDEWVIHKNGLPEAEALEVKKLEGEKV